MGREGQSFSCGVRCLSNGWGVWGSCNHFHKETCLSRGLNDLSHREGGLEG